MFQLVKTLSIPQLLTRQMPTVIISLIIAELFYKFHSFTLECAAFLATWFVLDAAVQLVAPQRTTAPAGETK